MKLTLSVIVMLNAGLWAVMLYASDQFVSKDSFELMREDISYIRNKVDKLYERSRSH